MDNLFENEIGGAIKGSVDGKSQRYECRPEGGIYAILRIYSKSIGYTQCGYNAKLRLYTSTADIPELSAMSLILRHI